MEQTSLSEYLAPLRVDVDDAEKDRIIADATQNLSDGTAHIIGFSGKKGSGKDTVAQYFIRRLGEEGRVAKQTPTAMGIKNEAQAMFDLIYGWIDDSARFDNQTSIAQSHHRGNAQEERERAWNEFEKSFTSRFDISHWHFEHILSLVYPLLTKDKTITGMSRNNEVIALLQYLGKDVRQPQDALYWCRQMLWRIALNAANGGTSLVTDVRYLHDAESILNTGGYLIRLDVAPEEQAKRLMGRDGVTVPEETLNHISETALDDFPDFNLRIDTNVGGSDYTCDTAYTSWKESRNV